MRQAEKVKTKFYSKIPFLLDPRKKIPKKNSKKIQKIKKTSFLRYFQPKRDEIGREWQKKILDPNSVHTRPEKENSKKNSKKIQKIKKRNFLHYFQPKRDEVGREREEKIQVPNSVHTQPGQENSEKNSKKIQKIKKPLFGIIPSQNGMRQAKKEKKNFSPEFRSYQTPAGQFRRKQQKNSKNQKTTFQHYFWPKWDEIG